MNWGNPAARNPTFTSVGRGLLHLQLTKVGASCQLTTTLLVRGFDHPPDSAVLGRTLHILERMAWARPEPRTQ